MRSIGLSLVLASMVAAIACSSDRALAPSSGHTGQISDIPPELFAAYTRVNLPGTGTVVALNDSGDVVGAGALGGILWHGAAHERITLPIGPAAIANDGTVAGVIDGHAATWKNGRVTILDTAESVALAICRCETATVVGSVKVNGVNHAAISVDGIRIDAGLPPRSGFAEFSSIATGFVVGNALVRAFDPRNNDSTDFLEPYSWSPAGGWAPFRLSNAAIAAIVSLNSHGMGVGPGFAFGRDSARAVLYDLSAGTGEDQFSSSPFYNNIRPTGINDSGLISADADLLDTANGPVTIALVNGLVLPPGVAYDRTAGINSAGIVGGESNRLPVIWIPNP